MNEINKDLVHSVLLEQRQAFDALSEQELTPRLAYTDLIPTLKTPHPVIISGLRRAGKSTLLVQIANHFRKVKPATDFFYINFEDERFVGFQAKDFNVILETAIEIFGDYKIFFIDEIQNVEGWERFVRRLSDAGYKFFVTGSNASLLSQDLGTRLTGRYVPIELLPFSFSEYLAFRGNQKPLTLKRGAPITTTQRSILKRSGTSYLKHGGVPEALKYPGLPILQNLYHDILFRDIVARHKVTEIAALREISFRLLSNPGTMVVFDKLKSQVGLGSVNTVKNFIRYFQDSWLFLVINRYSPSVKQQQLNAKKIYCIDSGLAQTVGFHGSPNRGHLLENLVALHLRRSIQEFYYFKTSEGYEVDFFIPSLRLFIQVAKSLSNAETRTRELRALTKALKEMPKTSGIVITEDAPQSLRENGYTIACHSIWSWLLDPVCV